MPGHIAIVTIGAAISLEIIDAKSYAEPEAG
jgi:hypothetical protein